LSDPLRRVRNAEYQLRIRKLTVDAGVIALIYEAFPELGAIAAGYVSKPATA